VTAADPHPAHSDAELIAGWRAGDERAAGELVKRHGQAVARYLSAAGADTDLEDLVQEAFFRAFRKIDTLKGGASFRTWVMTIGRNALRDLRRKRGGRPMLSLEERDIPDDRSDPHDEVIGRDLEERLHDAVVQLPPMQRDVFLLRAQQGLGYQEIAEALDTSQGAARVHYHHAVRRLKAALEEAG
jgi:RNA polymerase sigma-70 factor, ECF subfamily